MVEAPEIVIYVGPVNSSSGAKIMFGNSSLGSRTELPCLEDEHGAVPTILSPENPSIPFGYFGGPWLPMSYSGEAAKYFFELDHPLQVLEIGHKRKRISESLNRLVPRDQLDLFVDNEVEELFQQLEDARLSGRKLYSRWEENVNGKVRSLSLPNEALGKFLKRYVKPVIEMAPCHTSCHGGEVGWSVKKSLETHLPMGSVLTFDLSKAFESTDIQYVFDFFYRILKDREDPETARDLSGFLTSISTVYYKSRHSCGIPLGSPVGTALFNRLLFPIDDLMGKSAKKRNLRFTRWVDDFTISAPEANRNRGKFFGAISIVRDDFPIAMDKVFFQQDKPAYYVMGHKILGNMVFPCDEDEFKGHRGEPIDLECFANGLEIEHGFGFMEPWIDDYEVPEIGTDGTQGEIVF